MALVPRGRWRWVVVLLLSTAAIVFVADRLFPSQPFAEEWEPLPPNAATAELEKAGVQVSAVCEIHSRLPGSVLEDLPDALSDLFCTRGASRTGVELASAQVTEANLRRIKSLPKPICLAIGGDPITPEQVELLKTALGEVELRSLDFADGSVGSASLAALQSAFPNLSISPDIHHVALKEAGARVEACAVSYPLLPDVVDQRLPSRASAAVSTAGESFMIVALPSDQVSEENLLHIASLSGHVALSVVDGDLAVDQVAILKTLAGHAKVRSLSFDRDDSVSDSAVHDLQRALFGISVECRPPVQ